MARMLQSINSIQLQRCRGLSDFADMTEGEVCSVELFQVFARFITEIATTGKDNNKLLMKETCTQYVSGFKNVAYNKFLFRHDKGDAMVYKVEECYYFFSQQKANTSAVSRRQILLGVAVQEKSDAVDRTLLTFITKGFMKVKTLIVLLTHLETVLILNI
jgi:hypothetical protein